MADKQDNAKLSRRDFLNVAGVALGGAVLVACDSEFEANNVRFSEVKAGDVSFLKTPVSDNPEYVTVGYRVSNEDLEGHLFSRVVNGNVTTLPFKEGEATRRMVGEINGNELMKLKKSDELPSGKTVGVYPNAELPRDINDRKDFPEKADIYGIKICIAPRDYMGDGKNPVEINANIKKYDAGPENFENNLKYMGEGWAIGFYNSENKTFIITGYVGDSRALVEDR